MSDRGEGLHFDRTEIHAIGVFRALYLGEMLCIIPAIRALRRCYPHATLTLIGLPWQKDFVKKFSHYFDNFIDFPGWPGLPEQDPRKDDIVRFLQQVRGQKFDLLLQMHNNGFIANNMCLLWGAKYLCGLRKSVDAKPNTSLFPISDDDDHEVLRFLKLIDALKIPQQGTELEFPLSKDVVSNIKQNLLSLGLEPKRFVCIYPGARDPRKRWSPENFAFIANQLIEQHYTIVLTGSVSEKSLLSTVEKQIGYKVINLVEKLGVIGEEELAALIYQSQCLISNDTGLSHIAAALQIPSVIIFSPFSSMKRWAPLNNKLHRPIPAEKADDPEYILYCILDHLVKHSATQSVTLSE